MIKVDSKFAKKISKAKEFDASACLNCGVCSAICPMGINLLPRQLFHYALLGAKEKVLEKKQFFHAFYAGCVRKTVPLM